MKQKKRGQRKNQGGYCCTARACTLDERTRNEGRNCRGAAEVNFLPASCSSLAVVCVFLRSHLAVLCFYFVLRIPERASVFFCSNYRVVIRHYFFLTDTPDLCLSGDDGGVQDHGVQRPAIPSLPLLFERQIHIFLRTI